MHESRSRIVSLRRVAHWVMAGAIASGVPGCRLQTEGGAPVAEQALAPDFDLPAHDGRTVSLAELLARGPAVLVFYRGHW